MSRKNRLNLPPDLKAKFTKVLGKTPTTPLLLKLLDKGVAMDNTDIEQGRTPYTPREHAETVASSSTVPIDVDDALAGVAEAQQRRLAEGQDHVRARISEHTARGLNPSAPAEDPEAAKLAEEIPPLTSAPQWVRDPAAVLPMALQDDDAEIARMKGAGMAKVREVADTMERQVLQRMPSIKASGGKLRSLEEAAEILISELEPNHQDEIHQLVAESGLAPWVIILGATARMADLKELHAGEFNPEWSNRAPGGGRPASVKEQKCQMCGGVLPADARRGAVACCNNHGSEKVTHSEACPLSWLEMRQGRWVDTRGLGVRA